MHAENARIRMGSKAMSTHLGPDASESDRVRQFVAEEYVKPARIRGDRSFSVVVGDVHRSLGFRNRVPLVCTALKSNKFLQEHHLVLKKAEGPPSGLSTTVKLTYEFEAGNAAGATPRNPLWDLLGVGKEMFRRLGGGEAFIRRERQDLNGLGRKDAL
jgi:hypothetical protein